MSEQTNNKPIIHMVYRDTNGVIRAAVTPEEQKIAREQIRQHEERNREQIRQAQENARTIPTIPALIPLNKSRPENAPIIPIIQPHPQNLTNMIPFTTNIDEFHKKHLYNFDNSLSNIPIGEKQGTKTKKFQYHEICHYKNLPRNYLGIIHNIIDLISRNSSVLELKDDPSNIISHHYQENPIISSRAELTNNLKLNNYFNDISRITNTNVDLFFTSNTIGQQLNIAKIFNKAMYDNLMLNSKGLSDEEKKSNVIID